MIQFSRIPVEWILEIGRNLRIQNVSSHIIDT